ncbi:MAG: type I restriction-modification enzyme R subunit C-terminal domain-containing protein [Thermoplasmata archaeon]
MEPEEEARREIDSSLENAGWVLQDRDQANVRAGRGVAIREFPLKAGHGEADYLLFVDGKAAGAIEAKPAGTTLTGVERQSEKYGAGLPDQIPRYLSPLPFLYESTGMETHFTNRLDPEPRSRLVMGFHRPETLAKWLEEPETPSFRGRLRQLPPLVEAGLWPIQARAVRHLEESLAKDRPRALIQMATGAGKTVTAVTSVYRLVKFGGAQRVLFLVDRSNLGRQALKEFQSYTTPDDGRKFTELYNVQLLTSNKIDPVAKVVITTIQRLYSMLKGEQELDPVLEEGSQFTPGGQAPAEPVGVPYNPNIPIEFFDFIFIDECHRSIYTVWRQVIEYFDSFLVGLTATPNSQTFGFFHRNLVVEYNHEQAVTDGINVPFDVYEIETRITDQGATIAAKQYVDKRDRQTRQIRWEQLDEPLTYAADRLDRDVVAMDQIRTVVRTFRDKLPTEIFPGRTEVPKTLVYAKDDSHADDLVQVIREEFGKGNEFCQKITYKTTGVPPEQLIRDFRVSYNPRIAVSVDMIATGTDIRPVEIVWFMRAVKSRTLFEQMKGRGVRVIGDTDLQQVTPDARTKTHFVIVDAVGVCETELEDSRPLEKKPGISFEKLLDQAAFGVSDPDTVSSIANRLARLDRTLDKEGKEKVREVAHTSLQDLIGGLLRSLDPDEHLQAAKQKHGSSPTPVQVAEAAAELRQDALKPLAANPHLRNHLIAAKKRSEQTIDTVSADDVLHAGYSAAAKERAKAVVTSFEKFIADNRDEIAALQVFYSQPHSKRLRYEDVKAIVEAMQEPPFDLTTEKVWQAYEQLNRDHVRGAGAKRLLTDIVPLIRFALRQEETLVPFPETVDERFARWISGKGFTPEQRRWLEDMRDHVAANLQISPEDFDYEPFAQRGGLGAAARVFGDRLTTVIDEINGVLAG